jgi:hypothetical protein
MNSHEICSRIGTGLPVWIFWEGTIDNCTHHFILYCLWFGRCSNGRLGRLGLASLIYVLFVSLRAQMDQRTECSKERKLACEKGLGSRSVISVCLYYSLVVFLFCFIDRSKHGWRAKERQKCMCVISDGERWKVSRIRAATHE